MKRLWFFGDYPYWPVALYILVIGGPYLALSAVVFFAAPLVALLDRSAQKLENYCREIDARHRRHICATVLSNKREGKEAK